MIKKLIYFTLCSLVLAMACTQESDDRPRFALDQTTINMPAEGGIKVVTITTSAHWQASIEDAHWLSVNRMESAGDYALAITAEVNFSLDSRTATITINPSSTNLPRYITVTQAGFDVLPPEAAGEISGLSANACPESSVVLTVAPIAGAESYEWYLDGARIASTAEPEYEAAASGAYIVTGKNAAGESTPSPEKRITITVCPLPDAAGTINGDTENTCPFETVLLSIDPVPNALYYQWYRDGAAISGASLTDYTVTVSGTYSVEAVNNTGTGPMSPEHVVTITICEDQPTLQFTDIPAGNVAATGTPSFFSNPGPEDWTTTWTPVPDAGGSYYIIGKWAANNTNEVKVYIDYNSTYNPAIGVLWIDNRTKVAQTTDGTIEGKWEAFYMIGNNVYALSDYSPEYDIATRTLDFTGTYDGHDILLGVLGWNVSDGSFAGGGFTEGYANARLVITPSGGAPPVTGSPALKIIYNRETNFYEFPSDLKFGGKVKFDSAKFVRK